MAPEDTPPKSLFHTAVHCSKASKRRKRRLYGTCEGTHIASLPDHVIAFTKDWKAYGKQHDLASRSNGSGGLTRLNEIRRQRTTERHFGLATRIRAAARSGHEGLVTGRLERSKGRKTCESGLIGVIPHNIS